MGKKVLILLVIIITLIGLVGCTENTTYSLEEKHELPKATYSTCNSFKKEEIVKLYKYAEKMLEENLLTEDMKEDEEIYLLFRKYVEMNCYPDRDSRELAVRLTSIMLTMNGRKDFIKTNKRLLESLNKQFEIL